MAFGLTWLKNGEKTGIEGHFFWLIHHIRAICSLLFQAEGHFLFFGQFPPIFGFRPIIHSITGGLTPNSRGDFPDFFKMLFQILGSLGVGGLRTLYPDLSGQYSRDRSEYVNVMGVVSEPFASKFR